MKLRIYKTGKMKNGDKLVFMEVQENGLFLAKKSIPLC